jgi:hypothetical protein
VNNELLNTNEDWVSSVVDKWREHRNPCPLRWSVLTGEGPHVRHGAGHEQLAQFSVSAGGRGGDGIVSQVEAPGGQGLTLAHFSAQLEDLQDASLIITLNLSTFETSMGKVGSFGDKVSVS